VKSVSFFFDTDGTDLSGFAVTISLLKNDSKTKDIIACLMNYGKRDRSGNTFLRLYAAKKIETYSPPLKGFAQTIAQCNNRPKINARIKM
jgi:hypothetical protein